MCEANKIRPILHSGLEWWVSLDGTALFLSANFDELDIGFGKDKITGTYKPVWLYSSLEIGLENARFSTLTTCEVFDFNTDAWRYVSPAAPYRVFGNSKPICIDGSLHWFNDCEETKILSFDLHTETFQVVSKAPFTNVNAFDHCHVQSRQPLLRFQDELADMVIQFRQQDMAQNVFH
ncbi:predicted protein [Arabidopsis lyrata subsp. lyrata]|uniref:Predicted protein n=1 Tax=Arabidopsis lyrata subsp. lyrata TaxID=81972 RepID=D7KND3_ARALL|nr:predicted protein [Arabidopsis lyrata subsp. lyrata]